MQHIVRRSTLHNDITAESMPSISATLPQESTIEQAAKRQSSTHTSVCLRRRRSFNVGYRNDLVDICSAYDFVHSSVGASTSLTSDTLARVTTSVLHELDGGPLFWLEIGQGLLLCLASFGSDVDMREVVSHFIDRTAMSAVVLEPFLLHRSASKCWSNATLRSAGMLHRGWRNIADACTALICLEIMIARRMAPGKHQPHSSSASSPTIWLKSTSSSSSTNFFPTCLCINPWSNLSSFTTSSYIGCELHFCCTLLNAASNSVATRSRGETELRSAWHHAMKCLSTRARSVGGEMWAHA